MPQTNTQRQAEFKARKRAEGFIQVQVWIQPDRKEALENYAKALRESASPFWRRNALYIIALLR